MRSDRLTRDEIVTAAIARMDAAGLEGLNMRALGKDLGSAATAVYWHFGSKDDLVAVAVDRVWNEIALPDSRLVGWRAAAASMADELYALLTRHLWLLQAFGAAMVYGPGKARYDEHSIAIYEAAGFADARADQAATTVFTYVLGNAAGPAAAAALKRQLERAGAEAEGRLRESLARARDIATQFPRLRARLETPGAGHTASPENSFRFGLKAILDGLEAQLGADRPGNALGPGSR